jgi:hypothetical protein
MFTGHWRQSRWYILSYFSSPLQEYIVWTIFFNCHNKTLWRVFIPKKDKNLCVIVSTERVTHLLYSDGFLVCYLQNQKAICKQIFTYENWDRSISTANRPRTGPPWNCGGIAGRTKDFCPLDSIHTDSGMHSAFFCLGTRDNIPAVKRPGPEAPSSAKLRIYEVNFPLSHISLWLRAQLNVDLI